MKRFLYLCLAGMLTGLPCAAQTDTLRYGVKKNMPAFFEVLKSRLTYPLAWGTDTETDFTR